MARGMLEVFLVDAKGLNNTELMGKMDPYVLIQCRSHEHKSSVARGQGSNPKWNEKFIFPVHFPKVDDPCKLVLRILDEDTFSNDDFVGETTIYLTDLILSGEVNGVAEEKVRPYNVLLADRTYGGQIRVGLTFTFTGEDTEVQRSCPDPEEEFGGWKHSSLD
ncbi:Elicitor-responsive protein 1 [Nymphaea thermarum]|nr:Elicitor-responsive protein 1 [Nymphaea thermarum]